MAAVGTELAPLMSESMHAALELPNGARFYRCALQINPFAYLKRHHKHTTFESEGEYNDAIVEACLAKGIEVVAITDHYRVQSSMTLVRAARDAGLWAFGGFEAVSKDGVHFLCLFDPDKDDRLERFIGECRVHDPDRPSPIGSLDSSALLERSREWGAVVVAAHVASKGGLLRTLQGQTRIDVWTSPHLLACALPGPVEDAPDGFRQILLNKDAEHKRPRAVAIVNASDANSPEDLKKCSASCFIKMSEVSVEAFRQAFLDPESRIRLNSDPPPEPHAEFLSMTWEGGFLGDTSVHFNGNLNALVGGRGTGKSTMIESIRYALGLEPLGDEARKEAEVSGQLLAGVIQHHKVGGLLSRDHFSVDGTLIEAWASMKSFRLKGEDDGDGGSGRNAERDFHGEKRSNATHASTTDPDARLYRKGNGRESKLCYMGHALTENRHGLAVGGGVTIASGTAEREAALDLIDRHRPVESRGGRRRITVGGDKGFDVADFVEELRHRKVTPHIAVQDHVTKTGKRRKTKIDGRTTRHPGYGVSQRCRKRIEEVFGWVKTSAGLSKTKFRGRHRVDASFTLALAAYNLVRLPRLLAEAPT